MRGPVSPVIHARTDHQLNKQKYGNRHPLTRLGTVGLGKLGGVQFFFHPALPEENEIQGFKAPNSLLTFLLSLQFHTSKIRHNTLTR